MEIDFSKVMDKNVAIAGNLYIVATPIGNLGDITLRAIGILRTCDIIACETPSITIKLLRAFSIEHKKLFTYRDAGEVKSAEILLNKLKEGNSIALVSDAGSPTLSDPGFRLTTLCHNNNINVVPIPGACAAIAAMTASGFPSDKFIFIGFMSPKIGQRRKILSTYSQLGITMIIYESPHKLLSLLDLIIEMFGTEKKLLVAKEITKLNEFFLSNTASVAKDLFSSTTPKGEYVILL